MSDYRYLAEVARHFGDHSRLAAGEIRASSKTAKELYEKAESDLAKRMLMQHALLDGTRLRSRFVTDVLCQQGCEWAALPFAEHGITDSGATWQERRLRVVEKAVRPSGTYEEPSTYIVSGASDCLRVRLSDGSVDEYPLEGEDLLAQLLAIFAPKALKFSNETLVFDLDSSSGGLFDRLCDEVFASSALWPVNIVALGGTDQITKAFEVDRRKPENAYWFLKEDGKLVFLGNGCRAGDRSISHALSERLSLEDAILRIQFIRAGKLLELVKDPTTQTKLASEYLDEIAMPSARLTKLPVHRAFQEVADANCDALVDRTEENV
ncbi:hypothetical protein [Corynebacterium imitans]|uniref:Uncharacterized protein n=2 Tax=Corynebacterium imitans TaxID=156978 RepID=A0A076NSU3_9CORY|nr:hypothetical protein [Corynebacterium imitans]AIJ33987.1 hypothetical protein CIMIT_08795 [Corynebacterium imitans]